MGLELNFVPEIQSGVAAKSQIDYLYNALTANGISIQRLWVEVRIINIVFREAKSTFEIDNHGKKFILGSSARLTEAECSLDLRKWFSRSKVMLDFVRHILSTVVSHFHRFEYWF